MWTGNDSLFVAYLSELPNAQAFFVRHWCCAQLKRKISVSLEQGGCSLAEDTSLYEGNEEESGSASGSRDSDQNG